ncbi:primase-helicase family protein [Adhaeribacter arboris]|nr:primase-helicase family protein [Adhaeribacter arboris]
MGTKIIQLRQKIIEEVDLITVKHAFLDYINTLPAAFDGILRAHLRAAWLDECTRICENNFLQNLAILSEPFLKANGQTGYFYFNNGFVEVTKATITLKPYKELPGLIRKTQIIPRDIVILDEEVVVDCSEFYRFCENVVGKDSKRFYVLIIALGYLIHSHNSRTTPVAVLLYDKGGRTGKGIMGQALKYMTNVLNLDGRNADINSRFVLQRYNPGVNIVFIDDTDPKRLPFDRIFSWLTEGMEAEQKNKGSYYIPFEEVPKFCITSNFVFEGTTASHEGRRVEVELDSFYSLEFTPEMDFGHKLFDDWDDQQWLLFDNMMLLCCQYYLADGIQRYKSANIARERLILTTSEEFVMWAEENLIQLKVGIEIDKYIKWQDFLDKSEFTEKTFPQGKFTHWMKVYLKGQGYETKDGKSRGEQPRREVLLIVQVPTPEADKYNQSADK